MSKLSLGARLGYALGFGLWYLASLLPFWLLYRFSDLLYLLMCYVVKYRHKVIWKNLSESFPERSEAELRRLQRDFYRWFCDYIIETVKLMSLSPKALRRRMEFVGTEQIDHYTAQGRSCAVYLGHFGQWEWISTLPNWLRPDSTCVQIYHALENPAFDKLLLHVRGRNGAISVQMEDTLRRVLRYQRAQQPIVIGYIADQVPMWDSIHLWLPFLHHETPVLTGAERIIHRADQVPFYGAISRVRRGHYRCELQLMTDQPQALQEHELTRQYFHLLEANIQASPELYLWSHNRWKRTRWEYDLRRNPKTGAIDHSPIEQVIARHQAEAKEPKS